MGDGDWETDYVVRAVWFGTRDMDKVQFEEEAALGGCKKVRRTGVLQRGIWRRDEENICSRGCDVRRRKKSARWDDGVIGFCDVARDGRGGERKVNCKRTEAER